MAGIGLLLPNVQLFDDNGDPLAGGLLYAYVAGSVSTPQNTFTASSLAGGTENTNPIQLNSAGRAVVYLSPTPAYKFVLKTALGVLVWTQDNVSPAAVAV